METINVVNLKDPESAREYFTEMKQVCRVCLSKENNMNMTDLAYENESMLDIFLRCTTVSPDPALGLTTFLCGKCIKFLMEVQDFRLKAMKSHTKLLYIKGLEEKTMKFEAEPSNTVVINDEDSNEIKTEYIENEDSMEQQQVQEKTIYATLQNVVPNLILATGYENNMIQTANPESMCLVYEDDENYYLENQQEDAEGTEATDKENIVLKFEPEEIVTSDSNASTENNVVYKERPRERPSPNTNEPPPERVKPKSDLKKMRLVQVCKICRCVFTTVRELNKHFNSVHMQEVLVREKHFLAK